MLDAATRSAALAYYARIGAALFPIPCGSKNPTGIIKSFASDWSRDPAQWAIWERDNPGCNFGLVAGPSGVIVCDIDVAKSGRDAAWQAWCELCTSWGLPEPLPPTAQSARGGWHVVVAVPADVDPATLRQPDAIKGLINVRAGNGYVVAAGSYYDGTAKNEASGPYLLLSDAPLPVAPAALVQHCARVTTQGNAAAVTGSRDIGDVAALIRWLNERGAFDDYESWVGVGMSLRLEFGDNGRDVWAYAHNETVTPDVIETKWNSFATDPTPGVQTLNTWLKKAHKLGWHGTIRQSSASMFEGVAAIAHRAGASLPGPASGVPMMDGQAALAERGGPMLAMFLSTTSNAPLHPLNSDFPTLAEVNSGHALYQPLRESIERIVAMAEPPQTFWVATKIVDPMAVLKCVNPSTFEAVCSKLRALGVTVPEAQIKRVADSLAVKALNSLKKNTEWHTNNKLVPESDNSDNACVLLYKLDASVRWNGWLERVEIIGGDDVMNPDRTEWPQWTHLDDTVVAKLLYRSAQTDMAFRPGEDKFWKWLNAIAHENTQDPVLDLIADLEAAWDGVPRLAIWLSAACGVDCDPYHQSVARNIIGGIVRRARHPGCKHDTMPIFYGPQGTRKSTLARILAIRPDWFTDSVLLGAEGKELVNALKGQLVVEISEMGMRNAASLQAVKHMVSAQFDEGRPAYGRTVIKRQRRNILCGTTNDDEPLVDIENRRFLPVRIDTRINTEWLQENLAQLIGEAAARETKGESFDLPESVWADATVRQNAARSESDIETLLKSWFAPTAHTGAISFIVGSDLIHLGNIAGFRGNVAGARNATLRGMGFREEIATIDGGKKRIWVRGGAKGQPAAAVAYGTRYMVKQDNDGRASVIMRAPGGVEARPALPGDGA